MISFLKYIIIVFIIFSSNWLSFSQNNAENDQLEIRFLKDNVEIIPGKSFFNLLLIENKSNNEITINVQYNTPKNWDVIGVSHEQITLQPLENVSLPVRVAVSKNAKGGIGYAVVAIVTNLKGVILNSVYSFLKVPIKSKVKVSTKKTSYYLDHKNLESSFIIKVENGGNTEESVNVELIPDKSINIAGFSNNEREFDDFQVETNTTKTIKYKINLKKDIDVEKFKLHKVKIVVRTNDSIINKTIWFKYLDWKYDNSNANSNTPLNVDLNAFNILSDVSPNYRGKIYGKVLFKKNKKIWYSFENLNRDNTNNLWINSRLQLEINSKGTTVFLGDYQGTIGQSMFGRGVSITQKFNERNFITLLATERLLSKTRNYGGLYSYSFKKPITVELGGAYSKNYNYNIISYLGYTNVITNILNNHRVNLFLAKSKSVYDIGAISRDGWSYRLDYSSFFNKIKINLNSYYASPAYTGINNGRLYLQSIASYNITKKKQFLFSYVIRRYKPIYYINNILFEDKYTNSTKFYLRYNTSLNNRFLIYTGPIFIQQMTNNFYNFAPSDQFATNTLKYELGIKLFENYSNNSLAFSGKYGITNIFDYSTELNGSPVVGNIDNLFYPVIELSANFKRKNFNVYLMYFHGPYNISQQFAYFYSFFYSKSLNVIPSYERFIYKKVLKLIIRGSYISNLAYKSNRANINTGIYWYAKKGWKVRFLNSTSYQKVNNRSNYNASQTSTYFEFGISKSFNIQQPRLKFYKYEAVYYKDLNGNRVHDANEPGVQNVLTDIQRSNPIEDNKNPDYNGEFLANELLSNSAGVIDYLYMPEGDYKVKFSPQDVNIGEFATETVQKTFTISSDTVMHIPFVEKNKLFGKITLNRTKHSALGTIPLDNIKVTVEGNAKTYSALTDKDGYFELYIPVSDYYKVKINNIFYEHFNLRQDYYIVKFNGYKQFEVSFDFDEKERKIAFDESDFLITDEDLANSDFSFDDVKVIKQTNLKGVIKDANSLVPLHATVSIHNVNTHQLISETASSKRTGVYFTSFFAGEDYNIKAFAKGYWVYKENLNINQITTFENITHDILLNKVFLDEEIKSDNLRFESESVELSPLAKAELDNILTLLFLNPSIHVEVIGHTDNLEALVTNALDLSTGRASSVASYLVKHGLRESRVKIKGVEDKFPKSNEDSNSGREKNRRVEIRVTAF